MLGKTRLRNELKDYIFITLGLLMYSIGFNAFIIPYEVTPGGAAGISSVIFYGTGFPVAYTYFLLNVVLLGVAIKVLGWRFCVKTIYAVVVLTLLFQISAEVLQAYGKAHADEFVLSPQGFPQFVKNDAFMSTILGASIQGISLGIVFSNNGSTGGTDIIAAIVNKYRDMSLGQVIMFGDILIITSSMIVPGMTISKMLYGYCTLIIVAFFIDFVVDRRRQSVQFFIYSNKYAEIADAIVKTGRGVTVLEGMGWYTRGERKVLVVVAKKSESPAIFRFIQTVDPNAFVTQSKVIGVFGQGFDAMKVKKQREKKAMNAEANSSSTPSQPPQS